MADSQFSASQMASTDEKNARLDRGRTWLVLYLMFFGTGLLLALVNLWSAAPLATQEARPANASEVAAAVGAATPVITAVEPGTAYVGGTAPMLTIQGRNFDKKAKVLLNASTRDAQYVSDTVLLTPLNATDLTQAATLTIRVTQDSGTSNMQPLQIMERQFQTMVFHWTMNDEMRLLLLVIFAGALGAYIHALQSLVAYIGNRTYTTSWTMFYITRPFLGTALAVVFYAVIRGGFLVGSPADVKSVNAFGVIALSGLVGMFSDKATQKLADVFNTMFRTDDKLKDPLSGLKFITETLPDAMVGQPYAFVLKADGGKEPYTWILQNPPDWLRLDVNSGKLTGTPQTAAANVQISVSLRDSTPKTIEEKFSMSVKGASAGQ